MRLDITLHTRREYESLPARLQKQVDKQLAILLIDLQYPSLRAKKYNEANDVWQARVNSNYRFYFQIKGDKFIILTIIKHPK